MIRLLFQADIFLFNDDYLTIVQGFEKHFVLNKIFNSFFLLSAAIQNDRSDNAGQCCRLRYFSPSQCVS